ncbi:MULTISPECIES: hypothetical protein [Bradyrhizobium]|uniref:hypothetical protein n=1 Tax=Bradyrhizobium elkanii TaxID=29448 RepID=UPI00271510CA|nr:hypothetical protein [Bradyrhizobium elkanii]WLA48422.1 hypothetical protein QIH80_43875 [Bradyrhizobium elkanii]WLB81372.1 hypothetical protein QIH83_01585 [Bradyrhizobium elkanii]
MSETNPPPIPPAPPEPHYQYIPPPPLPRSGCATAFMVLFGLVLLLPGLCALLFGFGVLSESKTDPSILFLILLGLAVCFAGVMLIRAAIKGRS